MSTTRSPSLLNHIISTVRTVIRGPVDPIEPSTPKTAPAISSLPANFYTYTVQKGDTLYSIAKSQNTCWKTIFDANLKIISNPNILNIDQEIQIPQEQAVVDCPVYQDGFSVKLNHDIEYTVQKGDTLSLIAKRYEGVTHSAIFNANRDVLSYADWIEPGQVLKIPAPRADVSTPSTFAEDLPEGYTSEYEKTLEKNFTFTPYPLAPSIFVTVHDVRDGYLDQEFRHLELNLLAKALPQLLNSGLEIENVSIWNDSDFITLKIYIKGQPCSFSIVANPQTFKINFDDFLKTQADLKV